MFLYSKPKAISTEICRNLIQSFEMSGERQFKGQIYKKDSEQNSGVKDSMDITFLPTDLQDPVWGGLLHNVVNVVEKGVADYITRFKKGLTQVDPFRLSHGFNMQRYRPSQAFHGYHCERAGIMHSERVLVWMIYLNDVTDGGETEFYYQHHFERAEEGKLVIWPSDWTYLHRGIPSSTQTKYILTGWLVHFLENEKK
jgi:prolyl 4-hydroxylase